MLKIIVETKGQEPREVAIPQDAERVTIGRSDGNTLQLNEARASREHCVFEKTSRGWKLVDLESANGTRYNGVMVNSKMIEFGDAIQIGETSLKLVEVQAAPSRHSSLPSRRPAPANKTRIIENKPRRHESSRSLAAQPMKKRPPWELFYVAGGLIVLLIVGTTIYSSLSKDSELTSQLQKASSVMTRANQESELGVRLRLYDEAFQKLHSIVDQYPDSSQAKTASRMIAEARPDYKTSKTWLSRWHTILADTARLAASKDISALRGAEERIDEFVKKCPFSELHPMAEDERVKVEKDLADAVKRLFNDRKAEIDIALSMEEYDQAIGKWELFLKDYRHYPGIAKKAKEQIEGVKKKAQANFRLLLVRGEELIDSKRYREATVLFRNAGKKYAGTPAAEQAYLKLRVIQLLMRGTGDRRLAEAEVAAKHKVYKSAALANQAVRRRSYREAIEIFRAIVSETDSEEVKTEFSARMHDLEAVQGIFDAFRKQANDGQIKFKPWKLGTKLEVFVVSADEEWVCFSLGGGNKGTTRKRWVAFSDAEILRLMEMMPLDAHGYYGLGVFCMGNNIVEKGEAILVQAFNKDPEVISRINPLIARHRGEVVPRQGYVPYDNKWYTIEARDRAIEDAKITSLAVTVRKGSLKKAEDALNRLLRIPRGKGLLVSALRDRRNAIKKRISGSLQFNNATLVALKRELDKRRAYALDFIEDVQRYPDKKKTPANEYRIAQDEVNVRVKAVEEIWKNPYSAAVKLNAATQTLNRDLKVINDWLSRADKTFNKDKEDKIDMEYVAELANSKLNIKTFATKTKEQKLIAFNLAAAKWNATNKEASSVERKQVAILNEYRWMLGRRAVKIESMLVRAARGHSAYMSATGKWGHVIPGHPDGDKPSDRCKKAGYTGSATSENISMGHSDAMGTHVAWYNSSGHHRNMINRNWTVMGAGLKGSHWTQNFGGQDTTSSDKTSPNVPGFAGTAWRGGMAKKKSK